MMFYPLIVFLVQLAQARTALSRRELFRFSYSLFHNVTSLTSTDKNVVFSPLSVESALLLSHLGACGETRSRLGAILGMGNNPSPKDILDSYLAFQETSRSVAHTNQSNGIYINKDLNRSYARAADILFNAIVKSVDFTKSSFVKDVNSDVSAKTNGKIAEALSAGDVDAASSALLLNTIYFKALWTKPFRSKNTKKEPFYQQDGTAKPMEMMHMMDILPYLESKELKSQVLLLKYGDRRVLRPQPTMSMLLILPMASEDMRNVESKLDGKLLQKIDSQLAEQKIKVYLPKFSFRQSLNLVPVLESMGGGFMMSDKADFCGIAAYSERLQISSAVQQAAIDMDEEGSEAAAMTRVSMSRSALLHDEWTTFRADRPFLFVIRNDATLQPLFMGRVSNPARVA